MDSVAGEEGARIAEETQLDNPDNWWQLWRKISDEYQLKDQTRLCDVRWRLEEPHDTARQWLYRFPGCIFSVSTAAIEVEQSTPAFKTARTLARMLFVKRDWLKDTHHLLSSCSILSQYMGVSKNRGTPKWMVYNGKPYLNGWFGGTTIFGNTHILFLSVDCHVWCPGKHQFPSHVKRRCWGSVQSKTPERLVAEIVEAWLFVPAYEAMPPIYEHISSI